MARFCGGDFRTQVKVSGSWVNLASRGDTLTIDAEIVDITHKGDVWRNVQPACGTISGSISVNGFMTDGSAFAYIQQQVFQRQSVEIQVISGNGDSFYCEKAYLTARERAGDVSGAETIALTFATGTAVVYTAASPPSPPTPAEPSSWWSMDGTQPLPDATAGSLSPDAISFTMWMRAPSVWDTTNRRLFMLRNPSYSAFYFQMDRINTDTAQFYAWYRPDIEARLRTLTYNVDGILDGNAHWLGFSKDRGDNSEVFLVDGVEITPAATTGSWEQGLSDYTQTMYLFGAGGFGTRPKNIDVAELKAWFTNLTISELTTDAESIGSIIKDTVGDLAALYHKFDEGSGQIANDSSTQGRDTDLNSDAYWA